MKYLRWSRDCQLQVTTRDGTATRVPLEIDSATAVRRRARRAAPAISRYPRSLIQSHRDFSQSVPPLLLIAPAIQSLVVTPKTEQKKIF